MHAFFGDLPLLLQWMPDLSRGFVVGINRLGQLLILVSAFMALYQDSFLPFLAQSLRKSASFIRKSAAVVGWRWTRHDVGFEFPPEKPLSDPQFQKDTDVAHQLMFAAILFGLLAWLSGRGPFGWLAFPFEVVWNGLTLWSNVHWASWEPLRAFAETLGRLLAFIPLSYFAVLACIVIARPFAFVLSRGSKRVSVLGFRFVSAVLLVLGSCLVLVAT